MRKRTERRFKVASGVRRFAALSRGERSHVAHRSHGRKILVVDIPVPVTVAQKLPRTVIYKFPAQRIRRNKVRRVPLRMTPRKIPLVMRRVRVEVPAPSSLPRPHPSYVSLDGGRLNVHSHKQVRRLLRRENNRPRYSESKERGRKYRNGQLESVHSDKLGLLGAAWRAGFSSGRIADSAMVLRAIGG